MITADKLTEEQEYTGTGTVDCLVYFATLILLT
jgi:hypothetical protein